MNDNNNFSACSKVGQVIKVRILVVDNDSSCLDTCARMLKSFSYQVVTMNDPIAAVSAIQKNEGLFDLVIANVYMPSMSGIELRKIVQEKFDIPVILMTEGEKKEMAIKEAGLNKHSFIIVKPLQMSQFTNLWHYDISTKDLDQEKGEKKKGKNNEKGESSNRGGKRNSSSNETVDNNSGCDQVKKPKMVWSPRLHSSFVEAIGVIGFDKAVPKKILEYMDRPNLTRKHVASHLQKYRLYVRKVFEDIGRQNGIPNNWNQKPYRSGFTGGHFPVLANNSFLLHSATAAIQKCQKSRNKLSSESTYDFGQSSSQGLGRWFATPGAKNTNTFGEYTNPKAAGLNILESSLVPPPPQPVKTNKVKESQDSDNSASSCSHGGGSGGGQSINALVSPPYVPPQPPQLGYPNNTVAQSQFGYPNETIPPPPMMVGGGSAAPPQVGGGYGGQGSGSGGDGSSNNAPITPYVSQPQRGYLNGATPPPPMMVGGGSAAPPQVGDGYGGQGSGSGGDGSSNNAPITPYVSQPQRGYLNGATPPPPMMVGGGSSAPPQVGGGYGGLGSRGGGGGSIELQQKPPPIGNIPSFVDQSLDAINNIPASFLKQPSNVTGVAANTRLTGMHVPNMSNFGNVHVQSSGLMSANNMSNFGMLQAKTLMGNNNNNSMSNFTAQQSQQPNISNLNNLCNYVGGMNDVYGFGGQQPQQQLRGGGGNIGMSNMFKNIGGQQQLRGGGGNVGMSNMFQNIGGQQQLRGGGGNVGMSNMFKNIGGQQLQQQLPGGGHGVGMSNMFNNVGGQPQGFVAPNVANFVEKQSRVANNMGKFMEQQSFFGNMGNSMEQPQVGVGVFSSNTPNLNFYGNQQGLVSNNIKNMPNLNFSDEQ